MSLSSSIYNEGTQLKKKKDTNSMAYWKKSSALRSSRLRERQRHKLYLRLTFFFSPLFPQLVYSKGKELFLSVFFFCVLYFPALTCRYALRWRFDLSLRSFYCCWFSLITETPGRCHKAAPSTLITIGIAHFVCLLHRVHRLLLHASSSRLAAL